MAQHLDDTWDHPWDEWRLGKLQALQASCPKCTARPMQPCVKMTPPNEAHSVSQGSYMRTFHPERHYGPVMRMRLWLLQNAAILIDIPKSSSLESIPFS